MAHIFEPFYTTKPGNGMGLGLAICEQIMKNHGGRIWAKNNNVGVAFFLELPVAMPESHNPISSPDWPSASPAVATVSCDRPHRQPAFA
jgi:signal transduction histidine kinase